MTLFRVRAAAGFTLLETLVSSVIVLAIIVLSARVLTASTNIAAAGKIRSDIDREAQLVFDRLAIDLERMPRRADCDYLFEKQDGNDALAFPSGVAGFGADDTHPLVSVASYRADPSGLLRGVQNQDWTDMPTSGNPVQSFSTQDSRLRSVRQENFQVLGAHVFRFEFCFLLGDGSYSPSWYNTHLANRMESSSGPTANDDTSLGFSAGSWWTQIGKADYLCVDSSPARACWVETSKIRNIKGVLISIAILDDRSRRTLVQNGAVPDELSALLPDTEDGSLGAWEHVRENSTSGALKAARFYQRTFWFK